MLLNNFVDSFSIFWILWQEIQEVQKKYCATLYIYLMAFLINLMHPCWIIILQMLVFFTTVVDMGCWGKHLLGTIKTDRMLFPFMHTEYWIEILGFYTMLTSALKQQSNFKSCRAVSRECAFVQSKQSLGRDSQTRLMGQMTLPQLADTNLHCLLSTEVLREPFTFSSLISVRASSLWIKTFC